MDTHTLIRLVVGLGMTALVLVFAARRVLWLTNLIRSGQKTSDEHGRKDRNPALHGPERYINSANIWFSGLFTIIPIEFGAQKA